MTERKENRPQAEYKEVKTLLAPMVGKVVKFDLVNGKEVTGKIIKISKFEILVFIEDVGFVVIHKHAIVMQTQLYQKTKKN